jgi:hypothetical protein
MDVGPADEIEQDGRGLERVDRAEGAVGDAVSQQALDRLGEHTASERLLLIPAVKDAVAPGTQRHQQRHVLLGRVAKRIERLDEALGPRPFAGQGRPHETAVVIGRPRDELGQQALLCDAAAMESDARDPGLRRDPLQRRPCVAVARKRGSGGFEETRIWRSLHHDVVYSTATHAQHICCYTAASMFSERTEIG